MQTVGNGELDGRVAIVTGGGGGIGGATCRALAEAGARVLVVDVDQDGGRAVADAIGGEFLAADVSRLEDNEAMVAAAVERLGGLDLLHLNAGIPTGCGLDESFDLDSYRRALGVNLDGVVFGTHAALPALSDGGGAIVATASYAGLRDAWFDPVYTAGKHAVVGLTRSLERSLGPRGVRFNAVCPGLIDTPIIDPLRPMIAQRGVPLIPPERVAEAVMTLFTGSMNGECWFVQAGHDPAPFEFAPVPEARTEQNV